MKKIRIAVLTGGNSSEREISILSANNIIDNLCPEKYEIHKIVITQSQWVAVKDNSETPIDKNNFTIDGKTFDIVYPVIHGTPGENGLIQGYLQTMNILFVGCSLLTSSLTFNKYFCNQYLRNYNVPIAKSVLTRKHAKPNIDEIIQHVGLPCFVKPNEGGSSFGITKVKQKSQFQDALNNAHKESNEVIIEQFIEGIEITCGVFKTRKEAKVFTPVEIVSKNDFFDYQAKYDSNYNQEIIPARITALQTNQVQELTSQIYDYLNCKGIVRMDFILSNNTFYFLEVNTIPGMTAESIVPKMIKHDNMMFEDIANSIIQEALQSE